MLLRDRPANSLKLPEAFSSLLNTPAFLRRLVQVLQNQVNSNLSVGGVNMEELADVAESMLENARAAIAKASRAVYDRIVQMAHMLFEILPYEKKIQHSAARWGTAGYMLESYQAVMNGTLTRDGFYGGAGGHLRRSISCGCFRNDLPFEGPTKIKPFTNNEGRTGAYTH